MILHASPYHITDLVVYGLLSLLEYLEVGLGLAVQVVFHCSED